MRPTNPAPPARARRAHPRPRWVLAAAVATSLGVSLAACSRSGTTGSPPVEPEPSHGTTATGGAEFGLPKDPEATIRASGLPEISAEARVKEPPKVLGRAHLDVSVNAQPVTVPAQIGFTKTGSSLLHTTDASGIIVFEAEQSDEKPETFTIGQFFTQWGVKLDKNCLATYCTNDQNQMLGYLNGQLVPDPSSIPITDKAQIEIWYGPKNVNPKPAAAHDFASRPAPT